MALKVPKIVYPSGGGSTLTFQYPPRNLPYKTYEGARHDNVASAGAVERIYERRDEFLSIFMEYVKVGSDVSGWDSFIQYALTGGSFDYYPDSTSGTFTIYFLVDTTWNAAFKQLGIYTFSMKFRKATSDTDLGAGWHGESLSYVRSYVSFAALPAGAPAGSIGRTSDTDELWMSTGSTWVLVGPYTLDIPDGSIGPEKLDIDFLSDITDALGTITSGSADSLTITNGTMIGTTYKSATSGERVEIDPSGGIRIYNSGGTMVVQLKGSAISFAAGVLNGSALVNASVGSSKVNVAARGWMQTSVFSVTDADTVAWASGTFTASDGTAYSIGSGNTGNMSARTYVYLDINTSTTAYQTTTTAANAVGDGKVLIAVCKNNTTEATFQVFGGVGGISVDGADVVARSLTANEIATGTLTTNELAASTILAGNMNVTDLSAMTSNLGTILSGSVDSLTITSSAIVGGTYDTMGAGNNRVHIDDTNGLLLIDSSDITHVQLNSNVYAGILVNGMRSIDTNDIFMESQDQSVQLFVSQASARVSFAIGGATRGYFDASDGNGAGNQPTSLVVRLNGALQRVNYNSTTHNLYI